MAAAAPAPAGRRPKRATATGALAAALVALAACTAAPRGGAPAGEPAATPVAAAERPLLNSERIARRFGSYGVEVLEADERVRVSNLFSGEGAARTCRTFAVVRFPSPIDPRLRDEHAEVVAGGSIGAVLTGRGWRVARHHLAVGEVTAGPGDRLTALMRLAAPRPLAVEVYRFLVSRADVELAYATIAEVHHPAHRTLADLQGLAAEPEPGTAVATEAAAMLDLVARAARGSLELGTAAPPGPPRTGALSAGPSAKRSASRAPRASR